MTRRKQSRPTRMKCSEKEDGNSLGNSLEKEEEKHVSNKWARLGSISSESQSDSDQMDISEQDPVTSPHEPELSQQHVLSAEIKSELVAVDNPCMEKLSISPPPLKVQSPGENSEEIIPSQRSFCTDQMPDSPVRSEDVSIDLSRRQDCVSDIRCDSDQPLDLSLKPARVKQTNHQENQVPRRFSPGLSSSLASLEKKFGDGAFKFEGLRSKLSSNLKPKMLERFNTSAFRNALFGLPVSSSNCVEKSLKPNIPSTSPKAAPAAVKQSSTNNNNNKEVNESVMLTDFECSCKKIFKTLYELSVHMQETGHTPKSNMNTSYIEYPKLVRGQDMWLNQGMEQTRQILCCISCSESFKSLPELTVHMMQTRHYTNIVNTDGRGKSHKFASYYDKCSEDQSVFKCKICSEVFTDMESLANHMVVSGHHKKQTEKLDSDRETSKNCKDNKHSAVNGNGWKFTSGSSTMTSVLDNRHDARKLKEAENSDSASNDFADCESESSTEANQIHCENCNEKIETCKFVEHVRQCIKSKSRVLNVLNMRRDRTENAGTVGILSHHIKKEKMTPHELISENENHRATPYDHSSPFQHEYLPSSSPQPLLKTCVSHSSSKQVDYSSDIGGSALKAMESFIERSFTPSKPKKSRHRAQSQPYPPVYKMDYSLSGDRRPLASLEKLQSSFMHTTTKVEQVAPDSTASETGAASGGVKQEHSEPRHQSVIKATQRKRRSQERKSHPPYDPSFIVDEAYDGDNDDSSKIGSPAKESNNRSEEKDSPSPVSTKSDDVISNEAQTESTEQKYVCDTSSDISSSKSALESLQGLVYNHSFASEHPLDSLQRLIHTTNTHNHSFSKSDIHTTNPHSHSFSNSDIHTTNTHSHSSNSDIHTTNTHSYSFSKSDLHTTDTLNHSFSKSDTIVTVVPSTSSPPSGTLTSGMPSTVILVNPIVTVLPQSTPGSTTQVQITIPDNGSPSPDPNKNGPKSGGGDSDSEGGGEFCCQACSRTFVSKGSYRYHLSRCHLSSAKKYGFKDTFNMSPYVYLPLDHTAKFSKYYKMANELANKSKNGN